jgi:hypothetical protein
MPACLEAVVAKLGSETSHNSMNLPFHPVFLVAAACFVGAMVVLVLLLRLKGRGARITLSLLFLLLMVPPLYVFAALNPWLVDARFRTYRAFYHDIQIGMTRAEVMAVMDRHYPTNGPRQRPIFLGDADDGSGFGFFMNPEASQEPNCESIFLRLHDGKVSGKTYLPD